MTGLLLATLLNLSPGIVLADNVEARHVVLSETRLSPQFVLADEDRPRRSLDSMSRDEIDDEVRRLDDSKPNLIGPIVMLSVGAPVAVIGGVIGVYGVIIASARSSSSLGNAFAVVIGAVLGVIGIVIFIVGITLAIVGMVFLFTRSAKRAQIVEEIDVLKRRLDQREPPPGPPPPPPPPDVVPPQANFVIPGGLQTVLTF